MTTASELKSAAVVEVENKASVLREVKAVGAKKTHNATEMEERCSKHDDASFSFGTTGSTTAAAISQIAVSTPESTQKATSGSTAASIFNAASMRATGLPVSVFSKNSRLIPTQQNPVPLWPKRPDWSMRVRRAA